ncbi:YceI family protein [Formosa sp. S-31]|uniref:YceI family protein n=1 Tax=Formosa sp. S-31 TaxID=2790949 RepID=UPI003EB773B0
MFKKRFIFLVICCFSFTGTQAQEHTQVLIKATSELSIKGNTNINKFSCKFNTATLSNKIPASYKAQNNKLAFSQATLVLNNECFDCGKKMITRDFRDLIKAETYPDITLTIHELIKSDSDPDVYNALVEFNIAGVAKTYKIPVSVQSKEHLVASGNISLNIRDFNLENPKKAFGLIKIEDVISIHFLLEMETV